MPPWRLRGGWTKIAKTTPCNDRAGPAPRHFGEESGTRSARNRANEGRHGDSGIHFGRFGGPASPLPRLRMRGACGKDRPLRRGPFGPILVTGACCRSSVVEHSIGNGEVDSSILSGSTIAFSEGVPEKHVPIGTTERCSVHDFSAAQSQQASRGPCSAMHTAGPDRLDPGVDLKLIIAYPGYGQYIDFKQEMPCPSKSELRSTAVPGEQRIL